MMAYYGFLKYISFNIYSSKKRITESFLYTIHIFNKNRKPQGVTIYSIENKR